MRHFSAISAAKTGLAILLVAALTFSLSTIEAHLTESGATGVEKVIVAADEIELGQAVQLKGNSDALGGADKTAHLSGDCHVHILGSKSVRLTSVAPSESRLRSWSDSQIALALLHEFYRPPRA